MYVEINRGEEGIKLRSKYMKLGVLLGLLLTFWLLEVAMAGAAPLSCQTTRVYGDTRIETAIHISQMGWQQAGIVLLARADDFPNPLVAERLGTNGQVIIANVENFPDALALDPYVGRTKTPILLVSAAEIPAETTAVLQKLSVNGSQNGDEGIVIPYVVGGDGVSPSAVLSGVQGYDRIVDSDRHERLAKVYWFTQKQLGDAATFKSRLP